MKNKTLSLIVLILVTTLINSVGLGETVSEHNNYVPTITEIIFPEQSVEPTTIHPTTNTTPNNNLTSSTITPEVSSPSTDLDIAQNFSQKEVQQICSLCKQCCKNTNSTAQLHKPSIQNKQKSLKKSNKKKKHTKKIRKKKAHSKKKKIKKTKKKRIKKQRKTRQARRKKQKKNNKQRLMTSLAKTNKHEWLTTPLYGSDIANSRLSMLSIDSSDKTQIKINMKGLFKFVCQLNFNRNGKPSTLSQCQSKSDNYQWAVKEKKIRLDCFKTTSSETCLGEYTVLTSVEKQTEKHTIRIIKDNSPPSTTPF